MNLTVVFITNTVVRAVGVLAAFGMWFYLVVNLKADINNFTIALTNLVSFLTGHGVTIAAQKLMGSSPSTPPTQGAAS